KARLVVDPNEGWDLHRLENLAPFLTDMGVEMLEQPVPVHGDDILRGLGYPIPICADESCHTVRDLDRLVGLYDMVNVKLDKTGGLTAALDLADAACARGFGLMVGCMVATSLAMAPATLLMDRARVVDLDGPLLLREDRDPSLDFADGRIHPPVPDLWG
ncbi:MAG TPA: dipeptide epimerase, partial [Rhodospirillaceae bacterium]|nr:dipeptide epimerase [Rhodospirillaceae bacterium]